jgi:hypothetical protein
MNWKNYIKDHWTSLLANGLIIWILCMLFGLFYFLRLDSVLYDTSSGKFYMVTEIWQPFYMGGMILVIGLLLMLLTKAFKKNLLVFFLGILTIIAYFYQIKIDGF